MILALPITSRVRVRLICIPLVARLRKRADTDALVLNAPEAQSGKFDGKDSLGGDFTFGAGPRDCHSSDLPRKHFASCRDVEDVAITSYRERRYIGVCRRVVGDRVGD